MIFVLRRYDNGFRIRARKEDGDRRRRSQWDRTRDRARVRGGRRASRLRRRRGAGGQGHRGGDREDRCSRAAGPSRRHHWRELPRRRRGDRRALRRPRRSHVRRGGLRPDGHGGRTGRSGLGSRDPDQPHRRVLDGQGGDSGDDRARRGQRDPHRLAARPRGLGGATGLLRDEGSVDPAREGSRRRPRRTGYPRQHDLAGRHRDATDAHAPQEHGRGPQDDGAEALAQSPRPARGDRARRRLPGERCVLVHDRQRSARRRRLHGHLAMIVDIHAHYFPKVYNDALLRIGGRSLPEAARPRTARTIRNDDPSGLPERLQQMDDAGVQMQILSPAASPPYAEKEADAVATARLINDTYAELARKYPGRFNAVVSLPLPHIDASLREMERGLDQLGMLGVSMTCSCFGRSTAEAEFEPLYQEMNRRRAVLNYHPIQNGICSPMINDYGFTVSVGASLEDAAIVLHLIARRVPERFPRIKYVVPHLGGIIPMLLQRLDNQAPQKHPNLPERPSVTARRFFYDIVGHGSQAALACAWKAFGADHRVAGSDYPVLLAFESYRQNFFYLRESILPAEDVDKILHHNAQIVLGLPH